MKNTYIIWELIRGNQVEYSEVVGLFVGEYTEADELLAKLEASESSSAAYSLGNRRYYRTEPRVLDQQWIKELTT